VQVGYSDHTLGIGVAVAAVCFGARVIEKHFTLDRNAPGPDHAASLEPDELSDMVAEIRRVEMALGDGVKRPMPCELDIIAVARRSLVTTRAIEAGERFSEDNLGVKRPGSGISGMDYYDWIGRVALRDYAADEEVS
jgi:sialic acid synthase SpsE